MPRVGVIGAGIAGVAAALEAARMGARVTLFEASRQIPSRRSSWPSILSSGGPPGREQVEVLTGNGVEVSLGQSVAGVDSGPRLKVRGSASQFDAVVLATGSRAAPEPLPGGTKTGVHVLDSEEGFIRLKESARGYQVVAVYGSGVAAAEVAERLHALGILVFLLSPSGLFSSQLSEGPRSLLLAAADSLGIRVFDSKPQKVVGVDRVEAVVASGDVHPCDGFIVLPRVEPAPPATLAKVGRYGGVVVADSMNSSQPGVFAAGDCAEVVTGSTTMTMMSDSSALAMGRVAGANVAGAHKTAKVTGSYTKKVFGLWVASSGLTIAEASVAGLAAFEASWMREGRVACSLVVERGTTAVLGAQLVGRDADLFADSLSLAVSAGLNLEQLAYAETSSPSDISPIVETAREALRKEMGNQ
ncbi:MAG: FAD-dependent oxidoreductase [Nitrososphaerales archaeon]|nr:FAD-dependent oxidoreductase [Nitrososphaerales archaeon]